MEWYDIVGEGREVRDRGVTEAICNGWKFSQYPKVFPCFSLLFSGPSWLLYIFIYFHQRVSTQIRKKVNTNAHNSSMISFFFTIFTG